MRYGVLVGYMLKPGCRWPGEYLVFDLDVFLSKDLGVGADVNWGRAMPQSTKQVRYNTESLCFPLRERYDFHNLTLDGRELSLRLQEPPMDEQEEARGDVPVTAKAPCAWCSTRRRFRRGTTGSPAGAGPCRRARPFRDGRARPKVPCGRIWLSHTPFAPAAWHPS